MADQKFTCLSCGTLACSSLPGGVEPPAGCPMEAGAHISSRRGSGWAMRAWRGWPVSRRAWRRRGYCRWTRIEEIMEFARRLGVGAYRHRLLRGVAARGGGGAEGLRGRRVRGIGGDLQNRCRPQGGGRAGRQREGAPRAVRGAVQPGGAGAVAQGAGCGLNVVIGLCVGHDSLFFQHSAAPCTVLVAKDRVLAHNPCAALYTASGYYKRLLGGSNGCVLGAGRSARLTSHPHRTASPSHI